MTPTALPRRALLLAFALAPVTSAHSQAPQPAMTLPFAGTPYLHRWSQAGQNEFTPAGQEDLARWQDMLTLNVYDGVTTGEQLANVANNVLARYQQAGAILRTNSVPAAPGRPAEHLIVAALSAPGVRELVFTRFVLTAEAGMAIVVSHRLYGMQPDAPASAWFKAHDLATEKALMAWTGLPPVATLRLLPQSP